MLDLGVKLYTAVIFPSSMYVCKQACKLSSYTETCQSDICTVEQSVLEAPSRVLAARSQSGLCQACDSRLSVALPCLHACAPHLRTMISSALTHLAAPGMLQLPYWLFRAEKVSAMSMPGAMQARRRHTEAYGPGSRGGWCEVDAP